jgi:hypothetical protein
MSWSQEMITAVWLRGTTVQGWPNDFKKDACGAAIRWSDYGKMTALGYGWHIDHIDPNGGDVLSNLQPLQWENNLAKSDGRLECKVTYNPATANNAYVGAIASR